MCSLKIFSKNWWFSLTAEVTPGQLCHCASKMAVSWLGAGPRWGQDIPTAFLIGQIYGKMMKSPWGLPDTQGEWWESVVMICDDHNWWGFNQLDEGFRVVIHLHDIFIWIFRAFKVGSCSNLFQSGWPGISPWPWIRISAAPWSTWQGKKTAENS